jgi:hypothetical protein
MILISAPCYDETVGSADNHTINGQICEFTYDEMRILLSSRFDIIDVFGTFASKKDYYDMMDSKYEGLQHFYDLLHKYYDSNMLSVIFAPLFPEKSRNCLWICKVK